MPSGSGPDELKGWLLMEFNLIGIEAKLAPPPDDLKMLTLWWKFWGRLSAPDSFG